MTYYADTEYEALQLAQASGGVDEFEGQNCNDLGDGTFCSGWDGESSRCDCGNRRVEWLTTQVNGKWMAYASAY